MRKYNLQNGNFAIHLSSGTEEFTDFNSFNQRRNQLKEEGIILTYQLSSGLGRDYFADKKLFSDRMRYLRKMDMPFFKMMLYSINGEPEHYVSTNWIEMQQRSAKKEAKKLAV